MTHEKMWLESKNNQRITHAEAHNDTMDKFVQKSID